ncbi:MAG: hypothetical protein IPP90_15400 [Gemmatimonadaceae bacterium]|nr:hypothetical protein [Gemmatimonadaceae bacterium]
MRFDPEQDVVAILKSLEVPAESEWPAIYRRAYANPSPLPFPLCHLVLGLYRTREGPGTFIRNVNWFFEATYRFLLALVLRPYIRNVSIDQSLWAFFDSILGMGADRGVSLGGWRDFAFDCLSRVVEHPKALGELPLFLKSYTGNRSKLDRLRRLNDAFVHFRNRIDHGARDGNFPGFEIADAALCERALIWFLLDLEPLRSYSLVMYDASEDTFEELSIGGQLQPLEASAVPREKFVFSSLDHDRVPYDREVLASWLADRQRIDAAWSMHPFLTITPRAESFGGALQARLFERFVSSSPPRVVFELANLSGSGSSLGATQKADDVNPELLALVRALVNILDRKRRPSVKRSAQAQVEESLAGDIADALKAEVARRDSEPEALATKQRENFARRLGHARDPFFKGREIELEQLVRGSRRRSRSRFAA